MKALILVGAFPQIDLIQKLKSKNITTVLADYYEQSVFKEYANMFYQVSTLDVDAIRAVVQVAEDLELPCYINHQTAQNVANKSYMEEAFWKHEIPTARYVVMKN